MRVPSNITLIPLPSTSPEKSCPSQAAMGLSVMISESWY